jgi:hypothetical protein
MTWYDDLYVGYGIRKKEKQVVWRIKHNAGQIGVYVIALASNKKNLLDIIPATDLLQRSYPKQEMYVVGLAKGYDEAVDVAVSIVEEVYQMTGGFDVRRYFQIKSA